MALFGRKKKKQAYIEPRVRGMNKTSPTHSPKGITKIELGEKAFNRWAQDNTRSLDLGRNVMTDLSGGYKWFFQAVCRYYPMASAAVWTWKNLCSTRQVVKLVGGEEKEREIAQLVINNLDERVSPFKFVKGGGMDLLLAQFFHYIFTYGRFAGNMVLDRDGRGVERFEIMDPFCVRFTNDKRTPYISRNGTDFFQANEKTFFFYALDMDWENPYGAAMIESAWPLMKMADNMLHDMALSSSNAGVPRLHIKIKQPGKMEDEDDADYINRANEYFDAYIDRFSDIAPDDNFYSWDDLEIGIAGGQPGATGFVWKLNRSIFDEEIVAAFHLFPWIVGKSTQTTKNWVRSQFDLIMSQTETIQKIGKRFAEWIRNTELLLKGISTVKTHQNFEPVRDPARKDMAVAGQFEIGNVEDKVLDGFITPDDGARELGYDKAADPERIWSRKDKKGDGEKRDDKTEEILDGIERLENLTAGLTHKETE